MKKAFYLNFLDAWPLPASSKGFFVNLTVLILTAWLPSRIIKRQSASQVCFCVCVSVCLSFCLNVCVHVCAIPEKGGEVAFPKGYCVS